MGPYNPAEYNGIRSSCSVSMSGNVGKAILGVEYFKRVLLPYLGARIKCLPFTNRLMQFDTGFLLTCISSLKYFSKGPEKVDRSL